jgi:PAS domain S-box-containing protein
MKSLKSATRSATKIAMAYALISGAWILFSDQLLAATAASVEALTTLQMLKGWTFVLATSGLIFFLMRQEMSLILAAETAQRTSESNFRLLVENAPEAIFVLTRGRFAYLNAAAIELFGAADAGQLIGISVMDRCHPDFHHIARNHIQPPKPERRKTPPIETVLTRMDGSLMQAEVRSVPIEYNGERGALVFARDIADRRIAEEASHRFELLVDNSRDSIFFIRRADGRILKANTAACSAYGYSREEILALGVKDLRGPDTVDQVPDQMAKADSDGILFETVHVRKDGSAFPVEISSKGATIGGIRMLVSICRDITERRRSQEALRASELRFRNLANSMPQLVWTANPNGEIDYFNRRIAELQGFEKQADGSWEWSAVVHPEDYKPTVDAWHLALDTGKPYEIEHRLLQRDGTYKWHLSRTIPVRGKDGQVSKWYGTSTDIDSRKRTETALSESENRLRLALESAQMGIWDLDLKTNRVSWDSVHLEWFGIRPGRFGGTTDAFFALVLPEDRAMVQEAIRKSIENRSPYAAEFRISRSSGELAWMRSQGRVIDDRLDQPSRIMGVIWDITQSKSSEQKLMEATNRLDFLVTESPAVVFAYEPLPQPRINYVSRNIKTILGWEPAQFMDGLEFWWQCLHPDDLAAVWHGRARLEKAGKEVFEYRFKDAEGRYRWIHDEQRILTLEDGRKQVVGAWWDVTETKAAQEQLRRLAAAIEQAGEAVLITDAKGDIVYVNPAFEKITGYSPGEAVGKNPRILKSGEHGHAFYQAMWATLSAGKKWHGRLVNKKKDGSLYTEEATISPVFEPSGDIINYVAVKRDITREQALEQQYLESQKMEAIGTLAGGIAHDFNNILTIILANTQILEISEAAIDGSKDTLAQIITASKRARQLVNQILAFSRRGRQEKLLMNLRPVVKETTELLRASLPATIRLETDAPAETGMLIADPTQMQQVLMNLCTNAAHAMEKDGGTLKISLADTTIAAGDDRLEPGLSPGEYVKLTVADTGHGMPPWIVKRIFEPYFTTKKVGRGTGLGLSVVHGIVKSHGGAIKVGSEIRKGSIFEVYLPRAAGEAPETGSVEMPLLKGTGRILLVDDEPALTSMGQRILSHLGYRVQTTNSSLEALEIFRSRPTEIDLVITDLTMPDLTGVNLAKALLEVRPDLPIVLCTGYGDQVNKGMLRGTGIRDLLLKPLTIHELAHAVRMAIGTSP